MQRQSTGAGLLMARGLAITTLLFLFSLLGFPPPVAHADSILYVKTSAQGFMNCASWDDACGLDTALNSASAGDEIWVSQGTYYPFPSTSPDGTFHLKSGVALYGGFSGIETDKNERNWVANATTLSGNSGMGPRMWHVVTADGTALSTRLDGVTITGGSNADASFNQVGAGIWVRNGGSLTVANCTVRDNAAANGGGIFQQGINGELDIQDSTIQLNSATSYGGGIYTQGNVWIQNTQFLTNTAGSIGGGVHVEIGRADLIGGLFQDNSAGWYGGAANAGNSISITGTQFISNTAFHRGGGLNQQNANRQVTITGARFERNSSNEKGGGAYIASPLTLSLSTFISNTINPETNGDTFGGGLYLAGEATVSGSTFSSNLATCGMCINSIGGGLYASQAITVESSTFDRNTAKRNGSGMGLGDAAIVRNSTFFRNSGGGAIETGSALATVVHSTLAENTGYGIYHGGGGLTVRNSLLWANTTGQIMGTLFVTASDSIVQNGYSTGTNIITADPHLGSFGALWGGPTAVYNFYSPSSAQDSANDSYCLPTDQRGRPRPSPPGGHCDIGAFERQPDDWSPHYGLYLPFVRR